MIWTKLPLQKAKDPLPVNPTVAQMSLLTICVYKMDTFHTM